MAYDYASFSTLSGPLREPPAKGIYHVAYDKVMVGRTLAKVLPLLIATLGLSSLFFVWLIQPQHYPNGKYLPTPVRVGNAVMFWLIVVTEGIRLVNSITLCWSAYIMRNPIPVRPPQGLRIAFTTTIVPSKEPVDVVRDTLIAAHNIQYDSPVDVWLLDEGDDPAVRAMCEEIEVHHFSRKGVDRWNTTRGRFRAKTKHGNHNAWLDAHGDGYDVVLSVDPDHIPLPNFAERMLGYFRDPNVAFVVGPQVYGNFRHYLTRGAEAQNYMFHSVVQRAGNRYACGMFVGTNHAYRVETWRQIGGFQDSITEDLATSFAVHGAKNPQTNHRWTSVYTPDVVAVGEGPANWTDFFSQQLRWARGANEVLVTEAASRMRRLAWGPRLHYATLMLHYPTVALTWILGMILTTTYMALGSTGVVVHVSAWLALYIDVFAARMLLYIWLRRFNISPHEERGSAGISGIFVSVLCTPFYSTAFVGAILRRKLGFVVTPKGDQASPDRLMTFRKHLFWAGWSAASITAAALLGHLYPANMVWVSISLVTCLIPIGLWGLEPILAPRRAAAPNPLPAAHVPAQRPRSDPFARPAVSSWTDGDTARGGPASGGPGRGVPNRRPALDPATEEFVVPAGERYVEALTEHITLPPELAAAVPSTGEPERIAAEADRAAAADPTKAPDRGRDPDRRRRPGRAPRPGREPRPDRELEPAGVDGPTVLLSVPPTRTTGADPTPGDGATTVPPEALPAAARAGVDQDTVITRRPVTAEPPSSGRPRRPSRRPDPAGRTGGERSGAPDRPAYAEQETVLTQRREALASLAAAADRPAYTEDVTMRLTPRRRRVSLDGTLEELT